MNTQYILFSNGEIWIHGKDGWIPKYIKILINSKEKWSACSTAFSSRYPLRRCPYLFHHYTIVSEELLNSIEQELFIEAL